jgi:uncharacterized protein (TIGR02271 family)
MDYTVIGFFNEKDEAQKASQKLHNDGFTETQVDISPFRTEGTYTGKDYEYEEEENTSGFWGRLFGDDDDSRERHSRVGARTNVVTVYASNKDQAEKAVSILDSFGALDVDDYDKKISTLNNRDAVEGNKNLSNSDESIQVMKEDIAIGKREVETGGVRIKTRIIEKPVEETIRLRDERVYVTRKPMNKEVSNADAFKDKTIEMRARSEEAVVEKTTKVVEEIAIDKDVAQHEETVSDTVRETEVDIDKDFSKRDKSKERA